jgi:hypothetical protein
MFWTTLASLSTIAVVIAPVAAASAAASSAVSALTVTISHPSAAAGALTTYAVHLKTSASGGLSGDAGDTITVTLPAGTSLTGFHGGALLDGTTQLGGCLVDAPTVVSCYVYSGSNVPGGDSITLDMNGVTNPTAPKTTYKLTVSTTSDTTKVTSPAYTVVAAHALSNLTATNAAPTTAAGALTTYRATFKTSATGGMAGDTGSIIAITLPPGTTVAAFHGGAILDGATQVGGCLVPDTTKPVVDCYVYSGATTAAGDTLTTVLNGITNPTAPKTTYKLTVSTTSDPTTITSPSYSVVAAHDLANLTVAIAAPSSSAKALTTYAVAFKASATGGMAGDTGSLIDITLPSGTSIADFLDGAVIDGATQVGGCLVPDTTKPVVQCYIYAGATTAAGDSITADLNGVTNPTTAKAYKLTVSTTSDDTAITSPSYTVTAISGITTASVAPSSTVTKASNVTYVESFKATTGLAGTTGSTVTVALPAGTGVTGLAPASGIFHGSTQTGGCQVDHATVVVCEVYSGTTVAAGATVTVKLVGLKNPATSGPYTAKLSTSSDTIVRSITYCIVAAGVPCIANVKPASGAVGAAVTITGLNLAHATAVKFHGVAATITTDSATTITTKVPAGASTGTITVTTAGGVATSPTAFTVIPPPSITSFAPHSGRVGTPVTISGHDLENASSVTFNGVTALIQTDSATTITTKVPAGATTGKISVRTPGGTTTTAKFTVT